LPDKARICLEPHLHSSLNKVNIKTSFFLQKQFGMGFYYVTMRGCWYRERLNEKAEVTGGGRRSNQSIRLRLSRFPVPPLISHLPEVTSYSFGLRPPAAKSLASFVKNCPPHSYLVYLQWRFNLFHASNELCRIETRVSSNYRNEFTHPLHGTDTVPDNLKISQKTENFLIG
jgi:hypothetical protein